MSLLLKALKQAEAANADKSTASSRVEGDLDLEPLATPGTSQAREWVEPPGMLFGNSGGNAVSRRAPFRWPRLSLVPLTALLAALIALGYGVYLYLALQPPAAVESQPASAIPAAASVPAVPAPTPANSGAMETAPEAVLTGVPSVQPEPPVMAPANASTMPSPGPRAPRAGRNIKPSPAATPLFKPDAQTTLLSQAYSAYQRGAMVEAQQFYTRVAALGPNVDALLGLAAIASLQNREVDAQRFYREVLDLDPRNTTAQGALLDLLGNTDSQATESRLKTLIEREPSPHLYQTLGNLYADLGRWNEAQSAYFEAYRGAPDNADYAFNLAVSLDQLRQYPAALTYYEAALAHDGVHRFDRAQAIVRVQQLKSVR